MVHCIGRLSRMTRSAMHANVSSRCAVTNRMIPELTRDVNPVKKIRGVAFSSLFVHIHLFLLFPTFPFIFRFFAIRC